MKRIVTFAMAAMLAFALAVPAFGMEAADPTGRSFGEHHGEHAKSMGGFTGDMNPGVHHQGFAGWMGI